MFLCGVSCAKATQEPYRAPASDVFVFEGHENTKQDNSAGWSNSYGTYIEKKQSLNSVRAVFRNKNMDKMKTKIKRVLKGDVQFSACVR